MGAGSRHLGFVDARAGVPLPSPVLRCEGVCVCRQHPSRKLCRACGPPPLPHPFTHTRTHAHNPQEDEKLQADLRSLKAAQESYRAWVSKVLTVAATGRSLCVKAVR